MIEHKIYHKSNINLLGTFRNRNAVRAVIMDGSEIILAFLEKTNEYKFPGGGVKPGETNHEALRREIKEEIGAEVLQIREKIAIIQEFDCREEDPEDYFTMVSEYYLVDIKSELGNQALDLYEEEFGFKPIRVNIAEAIKTNKENIETKTRRKSKWIIRETYMLEKIQEIYAN